MADAVQFAQLLAALQGQNNDARKDAEAKYEQLAKQPVQTVQLLLQVLAAPDEGVRQQAGVLLRQLLKRRPKEDRTKSNLDSFPDKPALRAALLQALEAEKAPAVAKAIGMVVAEVAENGKTNDQTVSAAWPELLPKLFALVQTTEKRLTVLTILKELAEELVALAAEPAFQTVMQACMQDADPEVKVTALLLVCEFAQYAKKDAATPLKPFFPKVFELAVGLAEKESKHATSLLAGINDVSEENPSVIKDIIASHILPGCSQFGQAAALDNELRRMALEVLVTVAQAKRGKFVYDEKTGAEKIPGYTQAAVGLCIAFCLDLDEDVEGWVANDEEDDDDKDHLHDFGKESLDLLCKAQPEKVLPLVFAALGNLMGDANNWKNLTGALAVMATVAEYMENLAQVDEMVRQALKLLIHPHVRVRHGAWGCLAQFAGDHDPHVAETFGGDACQGFVLALDDPVGKVLVRALEAFQITSQYMDRDSLEPHAQGILQKLVPRTIAPPPSNKKLTTEGVATIATLAQQMEEGFAPFYPHLMPGLLETMRRNAQVAEGRETFGRCLECIGFLGLCVGAQVFKPDATQVMQVMLETCGNMATDDVATEYVMTASEKICETLKKDFAPFVPTVLPLVLSKLTAKPEDIDGGFDLDNAGDKTELTITVVPGADGSSKVLGLKTSQIEDMQNALLLVNTMVDQLKEAYAPHLKTTAQGVLPVFEFELGEEVRETAFEVWASLIKVARECGDPAALRELVHLLLGKCLESMETTDDLGWELTQAGGLGSVLKAAGPNVLTAEEIKTTSTQVFKLLEESFTRRKDLTAAEAEEEDPDHGDPDDDADSDDFNAKAVDVRIRASLCEILGALMMHHGDLFMQQVMPQLLVVLNTFLSQRDPLHAVEDRKLAIYVVDDMLEHLQEKCISTWDALLPPVIESVGHPNHALAQAAAYGLALAAKLPGFAPMGAMAAKQLRAVIPKIVKTQKKKRKSQSLAVRDNAVSALAHLLRHHATAVPEAERPLAWQEFLSYLPLKTDEEEAQRVHQLVVTLVKEQDAGALGANYANMPKILAVLAEVYDTDLVKKDTTNPEIREVVRKLGQAGIAQFATQCTPKQKKKLERMWVESQSAPGPSAVPPVAGAYPK